jgi:hypothetical protein
VNGRSAEMTFELEFFPKIRVGPFIIGSSIDQYQFVPGLILDDYNEDTNTYSYYMMGKDIVIEVENGIIVAVSCPDECIYNNKNLIGMALAPFEKIINLKFKGFQFLTLDWGNERVYEYEDESRNINLLVYVKKRRIREITVMDFSEDEE